MKEMTVQLEHGDSQTFNTLTEEQARHILATYPKFGDYAGMHEYLCQHCDLIAIPNTSMIEIYFGHPDFVDEEEWEELIEELNAWVNPE
jgi:hypothetical protein